MSDNANRIPTANAPHVDPSGVRVWFERDPVSGIANWVWENPDTGAREELVDPATLLFADPAAAEQVDRQRDAPFEEHRKDQCLTVDRETGLLIERTRDRRRVFAALAGGAVAQLEESALRPKRPGSRGPGRRPGSEFPWVNVARMRALICVSPDDEANINQVGWGQVSWTNVAETRALVCAGSNGRASIREAAWAQVLPNTLIGRERARARKDRLKIAEMDRIRKAYEAVAEVWPQGLGLKIWLEACRDAERAERIAGRSFLHMIMDRTLPSRITPTNAGSETITKLKIWFPRVDCASK